MQPYMPRPAAAPRTPEVLRDVRGIPLTVPDVVGPFRGFLPVHPAVNPEEYDDPRLLASASIIMESRCELLDLNQQAHHAHYLSLIDAQTHSPAAIVFRDKQEEVRPGKAPLVWLIWTQLYLDPRIVEDSQTPFASPQSPVSRNATFSDIFQGRPVLDPGPLYPPQ